MGLSEIFWVFGSNPRVNHESWGLQPSSKSCNLEVHSEGRQEFVGVRSQRLEPGNRGEALEPAGPQCGGSPWKSSKMDGLYNGKPDF